MKIEKLYNQRIKELGNSKTHFGALAHADVKITAYNPMCGDDFLLYIEKGHENLKLIRFEGYGCNIAKASTALLAKKLEGLRVEEATKCIQQFLRVADQQENEQPETIWNDPDVLAFTMARHFPERYTCVTLSWIALAKHFSSE